MNRYICVHGHFYQPPRENPWLEEVELQDSAYPYHDWNARVNAECYAPNAASRILDHERRIIDIVNNYSKMSFNFGPTLLAWLHKHKPEVYRAIVEADKKSLELFKGHGAALAQGYNHIIMPLANSRDKRTQVIWGIKDFQKRFNRYPDGMWLPETAVDIETLEVLAEFHIKFTILAPHQAHAIRKINDEEWNEVPSGTIDPTMAYQCPLPSGKTIALFFYDGPIAQEVAFGKLLENGERFAYKLTSVFAKEGDSAQIVHIATDGETYGHHHRFGDMALAYGTYFIESQHLADITVYAEYLHKHPPTHEVQILENTSWSCFHGVERWRNDCGCNSGSHPEWNQSWRAPLRGALDWLRDNLIHIFEDAMAGLIKDPWQGRDDYIDVILERTPERKEEFLAKHRSKELSHEESITVFKLLEMQRNAMFAYTSCGWFFDDICGIETVQVMQYAARAIQLAREVSGVNLEDVFMGLLERAPSNNEEYANGKVVYEQLVKPAILDLLRVGVHYAVSSLFKEREETSHIYCYEVKSRDYEKTDIGRQSLAIGRVEVFSCVTGESEDISFAVLYLGDYNLLAAAREFVGDQPFGEMRGEIHEAFMKGDASEAIRLIDKNFGKDGYSLWHLFKDEQRRVVHQIFEVAMNELDSSFHQIYTHHSSLLQILDKINIPLPKPFASVVEYVLNKDIRVALEGESVEPQKVRRSIEDVRRFHLSLDTATLKFSLSQRVNALMEELSRDEQNISVMERIIALLQTINILSFDIELWKAQNIFFSLGKNTMEQMKQKTERQDENASLWLRHFEALGTLLKVKIA